MSDVKDLSRPRMAALRKDAERQCDGMPSMTHVPVPREELLSLLSMASRCVSVETLGRLTTVLLAEDGDEDTDVSEELAAERFCEAAIRDLRQVARSLIDQEGKAP